MPAAEATEAQIVEALHDASIWAGVSRIAFSVGAAADGVLASTEVAYGKGRGTGDRLSLVACTAGAGGEFTGRGRMWGTRDIGKAARAVSDCLARGMIWYGSLEFLSAGRAQLRGAALDAQHVIRHVGGWYVLGRTLGDEGIMLAPASMSGRFVAPQSLYVGPLGAWTVSRIHPCRLPMRPSLGAAALPTAGAPGAPGENGGKAVGAAGRAPGSGKRAREGGRGSGGSGSPARPAPGRRGGTAGHALPALAIMYRLYMAMGYRTVEHGRLGPDTGMCLLQLENAIEDAAALGACRPGEEFAAAVDSLGGVRIRGVAPGMSAGAGAGGVIAGPQGDVLVAAGPEEMRYGGSDAEFAGAVRDAARRAYGVYCGGQSPRPSLPPNPEEAMHGWARPRAPSPARGSRPPSPWGTMHDWTAGP